MARRKMSPARRETYVAIRHEDKARTTERKMDRLRKRYERGL